MKNSFPFTDYDFYGYLACGLLFLFSVDYCYTNSQYMTREHWSFMQATFALALAYISGQIIAIPSSIILEQFLARTLLRAPMVILLSPTQGKIEEWFGKIFIGRHYSPLPEPTRKKIFTKAAADIGKQVSYVKNNVDEIFEPAYHYARKSESTKKRLDDFRNQYGFCRNVAFSGIISSVMLIIHAQKTDNINSWHWGVLSILLSLGMIIRFFKFYSSFIGEILSSYAYQD